MRYGSLFSGVGGFDLGFDSAGWQCAWQVEIDGQCRDVLRRHWPDAPKYEDVTDVRPADLSRVDCITFGSPCQDLSVAGRRAGLDGERSGLFLEAIRIADSLAPRWLVFENVPGLFSSNGGEDFAVCLEGFTGFRPAVPEDGWNSAGFCVGPLRTAVWRVCDTQFWGPPQRRRRVFIVGHLGGFCPPGILFEPESVPWNTPPSREAGEGAARGVARSLRAQGQDPHREDASTYVARPLDTTAGDPTRSDADAIAVTGDRTHALTGEGCDASEDGTGRGTPIVAGQCHGTNVGEMGALRRGNGNVTGGVPFVATNYADHNWEEADKARALVRGTDPSRNGLVLPFDTTQITSKGNYSRPKPGDPCHPLAKGAHPPSVAYGFNGDQSEKTYSMGESAEESPTLRSGGTVHTAGQSVPRRLTPRECERLQGFPDDWTAHGIDEDGEAVEMADTPRYRMMGNAVSVPVAQWIGQRILEAHEAMKAEDQAA